MVALDNAVPPEAAIYQSITLPDEDADKATVPVPQRDPSVPVETEGVAFMVAVTAVLVGDRQPVVAFLDSA